ncbi:methyl-accepting chemotaxis protein [Novosphingobium sp. ST904]|nr:methyl-accepting chemotaxis protein [Novosphingobium sp. ST904]
MIPVYGEGGAAERASPSVYNGGIYRRSVKRSFSPRPEEFTLLDFLNNWRLPKKLLAAFSLLIALLSVVGINGLVSTRTMNSIAQSHVDHGIASMSALEAVISNAQALRSLVYASYIAKDAGEARDLKQRYDTARADLDKAVEEYSQVADVSLAGDLTRLKSGIDSLYAVNERTLNLRSAGDLEGALALMNTDGRAASRDVTTRTDALVDKVRELSSRRAEQGQATAELTTWLSAGLAIIGIAGILLIWRVLVRTVAAPMSRITEVTTSLAEGGHQAVPYRERRDEIGEIAQAVEQFRVASEARAEIDARHAKEQQVVTSTLRASLQAISEGDLTRSINADFPPAYGELKNNFNSAVGALRDLIGAVAESAVTIRTGSSEIAQASEDLARRTESNAASLEETSAAITQMDQRLRATAEAAGRTVQRADGAMGVVQTGRSIADEAVQAMGRVSESAKGIDSVIEGLDKIAFQTRVLAMNAAVEAGRAGDAGRGFAVVADLVSALAMRSEEEAKRAREQLTATQTDIGTAVGAVQRVDGALQNISGDVTEVHTLLSDIAADNQVQSSTITQISAAIGTMDQATQQNAAMVEQTSAAARTLNSEVTALSDRAAMFRTGNGGVSHSPRSFPAATPRGAGAAIPSISVRSPKVAALATGQDDDWMDF